ncbi:hypothetical protein PQ610_02380 [Tardisphaera miroshnichenkoae]
MSSLPGRGISGVLAVLLMISIMSAAALALALSFSAASHGVSRYEASDYVVQLKERQKVKMNEDDYPVINASGDAYLTWALAPTAGGKPDLVRLNVLVCGKTAINLTQVFGYTPTSAFLVTSLGNVFSLSGSEPALLSNVTSAVPGSHVELLVKKGDHPFYELFWNGIKVGFGSEDKGFVVLMPSLAGAAKAMVVWYSDQWQKEGMTQLLVWCKNAPKRAQPSEGQTTKGSQLPSANDNSNGNFNSKSNGNSESLPSNSSTAQSSKPSQASDWPQWIVLLGIPPDSRATVMVGSNVLELQADQAAVDPDPGALIYPEPLVVGQVEYSPVKVQEGITALIFYAPQSYHVQITSTNGGSAKPGSGWYAAGSSITLTASPAKGYRFVAWVGSAYSGTCQSHTLMVEGPFAEKAIFAPTTLRGPIKSKRSTGKRPPRPGEMACTEGQETPKRSLLGSFSSPRLSVPSWAWGLLGQRRNLRCQVSGAI